ncbi:hypothetical protein HY502_01350 [Candidatus Woesebacteria bacterium]|nr:hypothetical protein [Candidatus Woesebacteria bacterium]
MSAEIQNSLSKTEIPRLVGTLQALSPDIFDRYVRVRGDFRYSLGVAHEDNLESVTADLLNIKNVLSKGLTPVFTFRDYPSYLFSQIQNDTEIAKLLKDVSFNQYIECFAVLPETLRDPGISNFENFLKQNNSITAPELELWLKFANVAKDLPPCYSPSPFGGASVNAVENLLSGAMRTTLYFKAETKSQDYHYAGPGPDDNYIGWYYTNFEKYHGLLAKILPRFREKHAGVIKRYGMEESLAKLEEDARNFKGKTRYDYAIRKY